MNYLSIVTTAIILCTGLLLYRRASIGLEKHLRPLSIGLLIVGLAEFLSLRPILYEYFQKTDSTVFTAFGSIWILQLMLYCTASLLLAIWICRYLVKRIETQITMLIVVGIMILFLITTITYTGLLLGEVRKTITTQLLSNATILTYAIESKKDELTSETQTIANDNLLISSVQQNNRSEILSFIAKKIDQFSIDRIKIISPNGMLIADSDNPNSFGLSVANTQVIQQAAAGIYSTDQSIEDGVIAPKLLLQTTQPILDTNKTTLGIIMTSYILDSSFLEGIRTKTSLLASLYAGDTLSATNISGPNLIGLKETNRFVTSLVLNAGKSHTTSSVIQNKLMMTSYVPFMNTSNTPIGMVAVMLPEQTVLQTAARSIELTFTITTLLIIVSLFPAYFVGKVIRKQIK